MPALGARGRRLWRDATAAAGSALAPGELVLLEEAARAADRLDVLDRILRGEESAWLRLQVGETGAEVTVCVDKVLAEVRQQQVALKQLLGELRQSRQASSGRPGASKPAGQPAGGRAGAGGKGGAGVADLTARIANRRAKATG